MPLKFLFINPKEIKQILKRNTPGTAAQSNAGEETRKTEREEPDDRRKIPNTQERE